MTRPRPDAGRFLRGVLGKDWPPPTIEYLIDGTVISAVLERVPGRRAGRAGDSARLDGFIEVWYRLGYDVVRFETGAGFPSNSLDAEDTGAGDVRHWADQHRGMIRTWEDFERYPWPDPRGFDFGAVDYIAEHLPEGMGLLTSHCGGVYETTSSLMSYVGLCLALYDAPELVEAVARRVGQIQEAFYAHLLDLPNVVAIFPGDDMGFRNSTLIPPEALRRHFLPWHRKFARMAHDRGLPYFLHSCGNVGKVMQDLIEKVGIDAKHSFEDAIWTAEEFRGRWGPGVGVLGGVDVDLLTRGTEVEIRARVRELGEFARAGGRLAIGSGNSIPSYVPVDKFLAMLDEALKLR